MCLTVDRAAARSSTTFERVVGQGMITLDGTARHAMSIVERFAIYSGRTVQATLVAGGSFVALKFGVLDTACSENDALRSITRIGIASIALGGFLYYVTRNTATSEARSINTFINRQEALIDLPAAPDESHSELIRAAYSSDWRKIQQLQRQGVALDAVDDEGRSALHWAAIGKSQISISSLWYYGCNLEHMDAHQCSPLQYLESSSGLYQYYIRLLGVPNRFAFDQPCYLFYPPEGLVFKGGGPKGIAYLGVQASLENHNLLRDLKRVAGTSAGAINAMLLALGYSSSEVRHELTAVDLKDFLDHPLENEQRLLSRIGEIFQRGGDTTFNQGISTLKDAIAWWYSPAKKERVNEFVRQLSENDGLCSGTRFLDWMERLIFAKTKIPNCTFGEFRHLIESGQYPHFRHLHVFATNMLTSQPVCFNSEDPTWDRVPLVDGIRSSMAIPFVFTLYQLRQKTEDNLSLEPAPQFGTFGDGGIINNAPIDRFDQMRYLATNPPRTSGLANPQTLAFILEDTGSLENPSARTMGIRQSVQQAVSIAASVQEILIDANPQHQHRIVRIDNMGVGLVTGFFASPADKSRLIDSGYHSTESFIREQTQFANAHPEWDPNKLCQGIVPPEGGILPANLFESASVALQRMAASAPIPADIDDPNVEIDDEKVIELPEPRNDEQMMTIERQAVRTTRIIQQHEDSTLRSTMSVTIEQSRITVQNRKRQQEVL